MIALMHKMPALQSNFESVQRLDVSTPRIGALFGNTIRMCVVYRAQLNRSLQSTARAVANWSRLYCKHTVMYGNALTL
jgi:hypothetical protein